MIRPNDYAIVIGINDYTPVTKGGLKRLTGAIPDGKAMEDWLNDPEQGGLPGGHCHSLYSNTDDLLPLQHSIDDKLALILDEVLSNGGQADRFYFYFAGHGFGVDTNQGDIALCVANWSQMKRRSALSSSEYWDLFVRYKMFKEVIFLSDCCRNTSFLIRPLGPTIDVIRNGPIDTVFFIGYSTQYMDQAYEVETGEDNEKRGIFTKLLIDGLKGAAAKNGIVNAESLKMYLEKHTPIVAQQFGYKQRPQLWTTANADDSIIFKSNFIGELTICHIKFSSRGIGKVELLNGKAEVIQILDVEDLLYFDVHLERGIYMLVHSKTDSKIGFMVSQNGGEQDVIF